MIELLTTKTLHHVHFVNEIFKKNRDIICIVEKKIINPNFKSKVFFERQRENFEKKYYNGKSIDNFNDKYNANKLVESLNIKVPEIYFMGKYNTIDRQLLYNTNYVIKPKSGHSRKKVFLVKNSIDQFTNKQVNIETFEKQFGKYHKPNRVYFPQWVEFCEDIIR